MTSPDPARPSPTQRLELWASLRRRLSTLLRAPDQAGWLAELTQALAALRALAAEDVDLALYTLMHGASQDATGYSASHAMTCAVVAELAASHVGATPEEIEALVLAALTMNVGMTRLQDALAEQTSAPSPDQRALIDEHPDASARLLAQAGVHDELCLRIVREHHDPHPGAVDPSERAGLMTEVLRRIDIYTAKLSRRAQRAPTSPMRAAREACLDADGHPDLIGAALLRVVGLYPPGTWVELDSQELALVVRRGEKAHTPIACAVRRLDGALLPQPVARDTARRAYQIRRSIDAREVRVHVDHRRVLAA